MVSQAAWAAIEPVSGVPSVVVQPIALRNSAMVVLRLVVARAAVKIRMMSPA
ncbi:MAG TPA: hypothetical protein VGX25_15530 [Actinophytocola sp.]|uniref:hypothetical protein n=1 Tax=Actinophytocola sp. TaxID=1872138 RepID=UPI002DDD570D|nr:hypothetical protein [Actinophytocola sp.]HEV2780796.1 hypothetical protein [Actinophytocola sp.]